MKLDGVPSRTIWLEGDGWSVGILDQTLLPHRIERVRLQTVENAAHAVRSMQVRGAPLIGVTAAYGVALAMRADASDAALDRAVWFLAQQRPTAVNLRWALEDMRAALATLPPDARAGAAYARAGQIGRRCRDVPAHRSQRAPADQGPGREERWSSHQRPDSLQCRLAGVRRLGHGDISDLSGARCENSGPRLGR